MYMQRKQPVANKLLFQAEQKKRQELHKAKLANMRPSLDTKPPPEHRHLYRNAKKEQLMEDRYARIEHENRLLLTKMSDIMTKRGAVDNVSTAWQYGRSLNRSVRAKELRRITEDNLRILHRIQTVTPLYDHHKWEEERLKQEKLVESICEFKRSDFPGSGRGRGAGGSVLGDGSMYSSGGGGGRSRSMGPTVGGGGSMLSGGGSYDGGGSGVGMSFGGMGGSTADGGAIPGGGGLASYHAEAGFGAPGGYGGGSTLAGAGMSSLGQGGGGGISYGSYGR